MAKWLRIIDCSECKHSTMWTNDVAKGMDEWCCSLLDAIVECYRGNTPSWCPLPNAPEEEDEHG